MVQALKVALAAAEQLSPELQRQLAIRLLSDISTGERVVFLQQLSAEKQQRLSELMDKNNDGRLSPSEKSELRRLGAEADQIMLANSQALAHALGTPAARGMGRRRSRKSP